LVERAKALLARSSPGVSLGELHRQAMQLLVSSLEKKRFAMAERPRKAKEPATKDLSVHAGNALRGKQPEPTTEPRDAADLRCRTRNAPRKRADAPTRNASGKRGRRIPAAMKREVYARDEGSCSYVDPRGQRCGETHFLELHHLTPFACGGEQVASNLALRCAAHNALAAEADFGRGVVEQRRHSAKHDSFSAQARLELAPLDHRA
ncbi:MAG TPA: hypothetical protein VIW29_21620, partial [Polyangiaceae bacterium]